MNDILLTLCRANASVMDKPHPYSARLIAEKLGITVYQARYQLNKLREQGLVEVITETSKDGYKCLPYRGWHITKKAEETEEYKQASEEEEAEFYWSVFGIDISKKQTLDL